MPGYSKAPRGLSVLSRVLRIFTQTTVSPSPSLRQCRDRYAIRAGRKLPDEEFRYHRTVIVTAVVHQGFSSALCIGAARRQPRRERLPLTVWHWTGVSPYTSAFALAETCVFGRQSPRPVHCGPSPLGEFSSPHGYWAPLLPKLRGQFAEFLNEGSLARLRMLSSPTCVGLRYGHWTTP